MPHSMHPVSHVEECAPAIRTASIHEPTARFLLQSEGTRDVWDRISCHLVHQGLAAFNLVALKSLERRS